MSQAIKAYSHLTRVSARFVAPPLRRARRNEDLLRQLRSLSGDEPPSTLAVEPGLAFLRQQGFIGRNVPSARDDPSGFKEAWLEQSIMERWDVRRQFDELVATPAARRSRQAFTGGSTGQPVKLLLDRQHLRARRAAVQATWERMGWRSPVPIVAIWGRDDAFGRRRRLKDSLSIIRGNVTLSAFVLDEEVMREAAAWIKGLRRVAVYGYTGHLSEFAVWLGDAGIDLRPFITTAWNGAEEMTSHAAARISEAFGCSPRNFYGCREVGPIAASRTGRTNLTAITPYVLVEVVDSKGWPVPSGNEGDVVVTSLHSGAFPLVRYRLGDRAISGGPRIGGVFVDQLTELSGRSSANFEFERGVAVSSITWHRLLKTEPELDTYQVVLENDEITVHYVGQISHSGREKLRRFLASVAPSIRLTFVEGEFRRTAAGKVQSVLNLNAGPPTGESTQVTPERVRDARS